MTLFPRMKGAELGLPDEADRGTGIQAQREAGIKKEAEAEHEGDIWE